MSARPDKGWGRPASSQKWHYFDRFGRSLCGRWGFYLGPVEQGKDAHLDNCTECRRRLQKQRRRRA